MNLMPTLISIGLAASISIFYLQNQSDEPKEINYRAALSDFEQSVIAFAAHTPLDSTNPKPKSHCHNLVTDFSNQLPNGSQWTVDIAGLDCDTAILSQTSADSDDFNNLLSAATASGRSYVTENDTSTTPSTKSIKWTQRLYTRTVADLGIRSKLKNNKTTACISQCNPSTEKLNGDWSHKDLAPWVGCPAMPTCGSFTQTRQCNNPTPQNGGEHCPKLDGTLTTDSNLTETKKCNKIDLCGSFKSTVPNLKRDCFLDQKTHTDQILECNGRSGCKLNGLKYFKNGETFTQLIECPKWSNWNDSTQCIGNCGSDGKKSQTRTCDFKNKLNCIGSNMREQSCKSPCGNWIDKTNCKTIPKSCLRYREQGPIKRICDGSNNQFKCIDNITKKVFNDGAKEYCDTPQCGNWGNWSEPDKKCITENEPNQTLTQTCNGLNGCKNDKNEFFNLNESDTKLSNLPKCTWTEWGDWSECDVSCGEHGKQSRTRSCTNNGLNCNREETQWQQCKGSCGTWENKNACPTGTCLKNNEIVPIKRTCNGGDKKYQCINTDTGDTYMHNASEYCNTPLCGEWTEFGKCPNPKKTCLGYGENEPFITLRCDSYRCERDGKFYDEDYIKKESCNIPTCGNFSEWDKQKNYCYKEGDPKYEIVTRTCDSEKGCKNDNGDIIFGTQRLKVELPKCGDWSDWSECKRKDGDINRSCLVQNGIQKKTCSTKVCDPQIPKALPIEQSCFRENCTLVIDAKFSDNQKKPFIQQEINILKYVKNAEDRKVLVDIPKHITLRAPSTDKCAIHIGGKFKQLTIEVNGIIVGRSGDGGKGGGFKEFKETWMSNDIPTLDGEDGKDGGSAICIMNTTPAKDVEIKNSDRIAGGQGGGGGGGGACAGYYGVFGNDYLCAKGGDGGDGFYVNAPDHRNHLGNESEKTTDDGPISGKGGNGGTILNETFSILFGITTATPGDKGSKAKEDFFPWHKYKTKNEIGEAGMAGKAASKCKQDDVYHKVKGCD